MNKDKKLLFGIGMVFLFLATVSFTYAYFTATIVNKDVKDQVVQTGTLKLTYTDGPQIIMNNIKPGATITKEISVKNTGTLNTSYNLVWQELANEIINDEMVIEATCTRLNANGVEEGTCENLTSTPIKRIKIKENVSIEANITHKYNITITFIETNADQNYNQSKSFTGTLGINEYVENTPIYCTFNGELTQGAEYVNGQYTYRYMQEYGEASGDVNSNYDNEIKASFMNYDIEPMVNITMIDWKNITDDGWGVILTDKDSTEPVTSKLCSYINNKPVVSMSYMFDHSRSPSLDLSSFDTSNVVNMSYMFQNNGATVLDLSNFDTSNVTDMRYMFFASHATTLDLNNLDMSKVSNMTFMFYGSNATNIDLSNFNASSVTNMSYMFYHSKALSLDLSDFDSNSVSNMSGMFSSSNAININLSGFNTSNVTDMSKMFVGSQVTTLDLSSFDTRNVTDMSEMFSGSQANTLDLSNFNTCNVIDMSEMFAGSQATALDLSSFDTSNVISMYEMFADSQVTTLNLSSFDTSDVINTRGMFMNSKAIILDVSSFNTENVTDMYSMFQDCTNLKIIYASDRFVTTKFGNVGGMFAGSINLVGGNGTKYDLNYTSSEYARIDGGTSSPGYFTLKTN